MMELPAWLPLEAWTEYLALRKQKKWVTTPRAEKMLLNKLESFYEEGYEPEYIIDEATTANWKSFYVNGGTPHRARAEYEPSEHGRQIGLKLQKIYMDRAAAKAAEKVRSIA